MTIPLCTICRAVFYNPGFLEDKEAHYITGYQQYLTVIMMCFPTSFFYFKLKAPD